MNVSMIFPFYNEESTIALTINSLSHQTVKVDEKFISLRFYDQGKGVDLKDSEKIFERFYSDRQENIKNHTGLGLSIAREIIEHMHGSISLDKSDKSDYPGACFLITLPIKQ